MENYKSYTADIYLFGETRTVSFLAIEDSETLRKDYDLMEHYILQSLSEMMKIQNNLIES
jgi:hypothetical protein